MPVFPIITNYKICKPLILLAYLFRLTLARILQLYMGMNTETTKGNETMKFNQTDKYKSLQEDMKANRAQWNAGSRSLDNYRKARRLIMAAIVKARAEFNA